MFYNKDTIYFIYFNIFADIRRQNRAIRPRSWPGWAPYWYEHAPPAKTPRNKPCLLVLNVAGDSQRNCMFCGTMIDHVFPCAVSMPIALCRAAHRPPTGVSPLAATRAVNCTWSTRTAMRCCARCATRTLRALLLVLLLRHLLPLSLPPNRYTRCLSLQQYRPRRRPRHPRRPPSPRRGGLRLRARRRVASKCTAARPASGSSRRCTDSRSAPRMAPPLMWRCRPRMFSLSPQPLPLPLRRPLCPLSLPLPLPRQSRPCCR